MVENIINFAGDVFLAQAIKNYLSSQKFVSSVNMLPTGDEIILTIDNRIHNSNSLIKDTLRDYLDMHGMTRYKIIEFENILTVGIPKKIEEISSLIMCEICGWRLNTEEELLIHRRTHWI